MIINVLESNFRLEKEVTQSALLMEPTQDMHEIEAWENRLDSLNVFYALVECRKVTKRQDIFLGWSLITKDSLYDADNLGEDNGPTN